MLLQSSTNRDTVPACVARRPEAGPLGCSEPDDVNHRDWPGHRDWHVNAVMIMVRVFASLRVSPGPCRVNLNEAWPGSGPSGPNLRPGESWSGPGPTRRPKVQACRSGLRAARGGYRCPAPESTDRDPERRRRRGRCRAAVDRRGHRG